MRWGHGVLLPPRSLCGLALAVAVRGQAAFHVHQGPCCGVWAGQSGGRLEGWGARGLSPLIWPQEPVCPWSEQLCPCGSGGLCAQADLTCPVARASGTPVCPQHCIQVPGQAERWLLGLVAVVTQCAGPTPLAQTGGAMLGWMGAPRPPWLPGSGCNLFIYFLA